MIQRQLIANCQREDLTPLEKARGIDRLMKVTGCTATEAARDTGFSPPTVSRWLKLLLESEEVRQLVEAGKIPASAAYELSLIDDPQRRAEVVGQLVAGQMTRDGVTAARKTIGRKAVDKNGTRLVRVTAILSESRSVTVASAGLTLERFIELIEELLTKAPAAPRTQGVELATFIKMLKDQGRGG